MESFNKESSSSYLSQSEFKKRINDSDRLMEVMIKIIDKLGGIDETVRKAIHSCAENQREPHIYIEKLAERLERSRYASAKFSEKEARILEQVKYHLERREGEGSPTESEAKKIINNRDRLMEELMKIQVRQKLLLEDMMKPTGTVAEEQTN